MNIITEVSRGIFFLRFDGVFDYRSFDQFNREIDYLLYNQGVSFYTFDFSQVKNIDESLFSKIQSKLIEIFLNCGQVIMCGLNKLYQEKIGRGREQLYYVNDEREAFGLINL